MKKIAVFLILGSALALAACGDDNEEVLPGGEDVETVEVVTEVPINEDQPTYDDRHESDRPRENEVPE